LGGGEVTKLRANILRLIVAPKIAVPSYVFESKKMIKNSVKMLLAALAIQSISTSALAVGLEVGAGALTTSSDGLSLTSAGVNLGYRFSDNLALEFGVYTGGSENLSEGSVAGNLEIDSVITGRVKYGMALGDKVLGYVSAGYSGYSITANGCALSTCLSLSDSADGATLGLGVDFKFSQNWGGTVEYVRTFGDLDAGNVGVFSVKYLMD